MDGDGEVARETKDPVFQGDFVVIALTRARGIRDQEAEGARRAGGAVEVGRRREERLEGRAAVGCADEPDVGPEDDGDRSTCICRQNRLLERAPEEVDDAPGDAEPAEHRCGGEQRKRPKEPTTLAARRAPRGTPLIFLRNQRFKPLVRRFIWVAKRGHGAQR